MKLRLIMDVEYTSNGVPEDILKQRLMDLAADGNDEGRLTGSSDAEVVSWRATVENVT